MKIIYLDELFKCMAKKLIKLAGIFTIILLIFLLWGLHSRQEIVFMELNSIEVSDGIEDSLPLPIPSQITTEQQGIRMDLEKVIAEKYYIIYSRIYGDQSYFGINLLVTDLNKRPLKKSGLEAYIKDDQGRVFAPLLQPQLVGFPPDEPLGWKMTSLVYFPYEVALVKQISIFISYQGIEFVLPDVKLWEARQNSS
ncbi:MAG: hypothetical protein UMV23_03090 [Halanaerobium sp.]|nr:hypothetical protein [Halanaerobium sp.]